MPVVAQEALHRPRRCLAEGADGVAFDLTGRALEHVQIAQLRLAFGNAREHAIHPARAFATRRALAARFGVVEARDALTRAHHARSLVHHDHGARTEAGTGLLDRIVVHGA